MKRLENLMHLSIIIPTFNEADCIENTINSAKENLSQQLKLEFILIDAGSKDDTLAIAKDLVDQWHCDETLAGAKYKSLNAGAKLAKGEVLLFLDADCILSSNFDHKISRVMDDLTVVGGAFEFKMDHNAFYYRMIEWVNRIRYRFSKNYYGDQGLFCRRSVFEQIGGFPEKSIMEAAYLCQLLRKQGKLYLLDTTILSSVRRFEDGGVFNVMWKDTWIWLQFLLGMDISRYAKGYWHENKKKATGTLLSN